VALTPAAPLPSGAEKRRAVRAMFDRIAPRYDLLNRLFTAGLDQRWRKLTLDLVEVGASDRVLDVACGTGDLLEMAASRCQRAYGIDFARGMLRAGSVRLPGSSFVQGDGAALPVRDASLTVVTCGFALRNFVSLPDVLAELARVLVPGGRLALIDVDRPSGAAVRAVHSAWFDRLVPRLGGLLSDRDAYAYLPRSTDYLPPPPMLRGLIEDAGFGAVARRSLLLGSAQIWTAVRS
jgi:demethylmenaquinone methyltransferase/2-methoxy-6-polyprenyl-1,4-benzoquinol methylase